MAPSIADNIYTTIYKTDCFWTALEDRPKKLFLVTPEIFEIKISKLNRSGNFIMCFLYTKFSVYARNSLRPITNVQIKRHTILGDYAFIKT